MASQAFLSPLLPIKEGGQMRGRIDAWMVRTVADAGLDFCGIHSPNDCVAIGDEHSLRIQM